MQLAEAVLRKSMVKTMIQQEVRFPCVTTDANMQPGPEALRICAVTVIIGYRYAYTEFHAG